MDYAPDIDWTLARRVSRVSARDLPQADPRAVQQLVAELRVSARRAGELAASFLDIDSIGAARVRVVDWAGWVGAVERMTEGAIGELGLARRPAGCARRARALGNGLAIGAVAGRLSGRLLGQYDAYSGEDTLYLVAPTILEHEARHGFVPADFRLWVALHEQTHALQFRAAPWLRAYLREQVAELLADDSSWGAALMQWLRSGDPAAFVATGPGAAVLARLTSTMTFLEGHADHTADVAGRGVVRTQRALRRAFDRTGTPSWLARAAGSLDKNAQYRNGLQFCREVARRGGNRALSAAFASPEALPTGAEIADPSAWMRRVHG